MGCGSSRLDLETTPLARRIDHEGARLPVAMTQQTSQLPEAGYHQQDVTSPQSHYQGDIHDSNLVAETADFNRYNFSSFSKSQRVSEGDRISAASGRAATLHERPAQSIPSPFEGYGKPQTCQTNRVRDHYNGIVRESPQNAQYQAHHAPANGLGVREAAYEDYYYHKYGHQPLRKPGYDLFTPASKGYLHQCSCDFYNGKPNYCRSAYDKCCKNKGRELKCTKKSCGDAYEMDTINQPWFERPQLATTRYEDPGPEPVSPLTP
ncbi:hypothetical protein F5Y16DRAFT_404584 [Xylariaceae sp. FL0255]|nr:hypothetical protein F5Y16DRAFT_404584 [Xylariaceae sp. FL0255]